MSAYQEAILFFDGDAIVKEMLYPEFEAVLDNVVGMKEFAGRELSAAFVPISLSGRALGAVLFKVSYEADGSIPQSWNIPLRNLMEQSKHAVTVGSERLRWVSAQQCPVEWHAASLWHGDEASIAKAITGAVARNRLGLAFGEDEPKVDPADSLPSTPEVAVPPAAAASAPDRQQLHQREQQHRVDIASLKARYEERLSQQEKRFLEKFRSVETRFKQMKEQLLNERQRNDRLGETLEKAASDLQQGRRDMERQLLSGQQADEGQLASLRQQFETELEDSLARQRELSAEKIRQLESELRFRDEELGRQKTRIARLEKDLARLQDSGGNELLAAMVDTGVEFVVSHAGAGTFSVSLADMPEYLQRPEDFVAARCGVTGDHYREWLAHFRDPVCRAIADNGKYCLSPLEPVEQPAEYRAGLGDRCLDHREDG